MHSSKAPTILPAKAGDNVTLLPTVQFILNLKTRSPFTLRRAKGRPTSLPGSGGLWPSPIAGKGDRETWELGTGTAHIALVFSGGRKDINQWTFLPDSLGRTWSSFPGERANDRGSRLTLV